MVGGDFLKCGEMQALNVINGFIDFLTHESYKIDGITTRLDNVERALCKLNLKEVDDILKDDQMLEIEGDWEPFIPIEIDNKRFLSYCDTGSMMSTMPKNGF